LYRQFPDVVGYDCGADIGDIGFNRVSRHRVGDLFLLFLLKFFFAIVDISF